MHFLRVCRWGWVLEWKIWGWKKLIEAFAAKFGDNYKLSSNERNYDYDLAKKPQATSRNVATPQDDTKDDDLYPDPEIFHRKILNKSRMDGSDRTDESIIKICKALKIEIYFSLKFV